MFFLCYSLTRHENPLEIFPYGDPPPPPHWKIRQIDPPSPLENPIPSVGGYGYFLEPHNKYMYRPWPLAFLQLSSVALLKHYCQMSHIFDIPVCYPIINYYNIGKSLFTLFASLTYAYHYLMTLMK